MIICFQMNQMNRRARAELERTQLRKTVARLTARLQERDADVARGEVTKAELEEELTVTKELARDLLEENVRVCVCFNMRLVFDLK